MKRQRNFTHDSLLASEKVVGHRCIYCEALVCIYIFPLHGKYLISILMKKVQPYSVVVDTFNFVHAVDKKNITGYD